MEDGMGVSFVEMSSVSENGYISLKEERSYKDVKVAIHTLQIMI